MRPPERLGRFILIFVAVYVVLMVPWPGLQRGYAAFFRGMGNTALSGSFWLWPRANVQFLDLHSENPIGDLARVTPGTLPSNFQIPQPSAIKDTLMVLSNRDVPATFGLVRTSSRYLGYGPTAMFLALILASPLAWRRKKWSLLVGLLLIQMFILMRVSLTALVNGFAVDKPYAIIHPGAFWSGALSKTETLFSDDPTVSFVVPVCVWFLVTMRGASAGNDAARIKTDEDRIAAREPVKIKRRARHAKGRDNRNQSSRS